MKKQFKGFVTAVIITLIVTSAVAFADGVKQKIEDIFNSINLTVNGKKINSDNILYNGTTYVPLREVGEMLGKEVSWDDKTKTAGINDKEYSKKNEEKKVDSGYSISNPVPIGTSQIYTIESNLTKDTFEITVLEVHRGNEAEKIINEKKLYSGNTGLKDNAERILVKIRKDVLNNPEYKGNTLIFDVYNNKNESYKSSVITTSSEDLKSNEEYRIFIIDKEDTEPKLEIYSMLSLANNDDAIWFKLSK